MSYSIALWDPSRHQPVPTTFDEATAMYRKLADVDDEPNYWFVSFAQRIQDHVRLSPNSDEALLGYYGNFVETAQRHIGALFLVDLPTEGRIPLLRLMVETATALNLVVYDDGSGLAFLPGGKVLPEEKAYIWVTIQEELDKPSDFPRTKAEFKKMAEPVFAEVFGKYGFRKGKSQQNEPVLMRAIPGGGHYIQTFYNGLQWGQSGYRVTMNIGVIFDSVSDIYSGFRFFKVARACGFSLRTLCGWDGHEDEVSSPEEFEALLLMIENKVIGILEVANDISGLDRVMNGNAAPEVKSYLRSTILIPHCLIVARLAGNPCFEDLVIELDEAAKKFWHPVQDKDFFEEWARLIAYLREEVKPLV